MNRKSSGFVPYYKRDGIVYFFLQQRDEFAPAHPNKIGLFGGGVEGTESHEQALVREVQEELGITVEPHLFRTFEFESESLVIFTLEVNHDFRTSVKILEGADGFFVADHELENPKLIEDTRIILKDFLCSLT